MKQTIPKKTLVITAAVFLSVSASAALVIGFSLPGGPSGTGKEVEEGIMGDGEVLEANKLPALLRAYEKSEDDPALRVYLGHHFYKAGDTETANVFFRKRVPKDSAKSEGPAYLLSLFHSARIAWAHERYTRCRELLSERFFPFLDTLRKEEDGKYTGWRGEIIDYSEGAAAEILANVYMRTGREERAVEVLKRLWKRRGVEMSEERYITYLLLLQKNGKKKTLTQVSKQWTSSRPFNPNTSELFVEIFNNANLQSLLLFEKVEQLEYLRPSLTREEYRSALERIISKEGERQEEENRDKTQEKKGKEGMGTLLRLVSLYAEEKWTEASALFSSAVRKELVDTHRFARYLRNSVNLHLSPEAEYTNYMSLEPLYKEFQYFYRHIWEATLFSEERYIEPRVDSTTRSRAIAALRAGILQAPHTPLAKRGRNLLWRLRGANGKDLSEHNDYPLLKEELAHINEFLRMGANPVLLEPVVSLLRYPDNIHTLNAELAVRDVRELYRVRSYLDTHYKKAQGRLKERLGSILGKQGSSEENVRSNTVHTAP